jgi:hypothetical protein
VTELSDTRANTNKFFIDPPATRCLTTSSKIIFSDITKVGRIVIPQPTGGYRLAMHIYNISIGLASTPYGVIPMKSEIMCSRKKLCVRAKILCAKHLGNTSFCSEQIHGIFVDVLDNTL